MRKETLRLYENAFRIIAHGISLHQHDILSSKDLRTITAARTSVMPIDIENEYEASVKGLYGEIVTFIS